MKWLYLAAAPASAQVSPILSMLPMVLVIFVFYFLLIRPQQKRQKEHKEFLARLEKNQEVVMTGGLHGTVVGVKDDTVTLRIAENVKVEVDKSAVSHSKPK